MSQKDRHSSHPPPAQPPQPGGPFLQTLPGCSFNQTDSCLPSARYHGGSEDRSIRLLIFSRWWAVPSSGCSVDSVHKVETLACSNLNLAMSREKFLVSLATQTGAFTLAKKHRCLHFSSCFEKLTFLASERAFTASVDKSGEM